VRSRVFHPDISQDIWFAKETVAAEYRTSDLAGTTMSFELFRAPDGKPQARNLRPAPAGVGMPPPPVNPNQHMAAQSFPGAGLVRPGFPQPALQLRPGFPLSAAMMRPAGLPGLAVPSQPKRRAWSPHAGSRAIATASKDEEVPGGLGLAPGMAGGPLGQPAEKKSESEERSKSSSRKSSESSDSSSERKKKKKKSKKSDVCSSSSLEEVRSSSRSRSPKKEGKTGTPKETKAKSTPEIEQAKLEALEKLRKLQSVEPKEARAKEWRALLRDWHPDKNPDKVEVAKEVFQFLQKGKTIINV